MFFVGCQISQIPGFRPQWLCQAKTDCWRLACPKNKVAEVKKLNKLTYRDFGADSDDRAVRVMEKQDRMQECADIRMNGVRPEIVKHRRHESWEKLLGKSFGFFGCGGGGKPRCSGHGSSGGLLSTGLRSISDGCIKASRRRPFDGADRKRADLRRLRRRRGIRGGRGSRVSLEERVPTYG